MFFLFEAGEEAKRWVLEAIGDQAVGGVIRGHTHLNSVSNHDLYAVFLHTAGENAPYGHIIFALNFHGPTPQNPCDLTLQLN